MCFSGVKDAAPHMLEQVVRVAMLHISRMLVESGSNSMTNELGLGFANRLRDMGMSDRTSIWNIVLVRNKGDIALLEEVGTTGLET